MENIKLGDSARDQISGFTGIVVAVTEWLNGCRRITIQPRELKDGKPVDSVTFDVEQIELLKASEMPGPVKQTGGPSISPVRHVSPSRS